MTINVELLDQALAWVEQEAEKPEPKRKWVQASWRRESTTNGCGTAFCVAGYVGHIAGGKWAQNDPLKFGFDDFLANPGESPSWELEDGTLVVSAEARARRVLGLDQWQANDLFAAGNDVRRIRRVVADLKTEAAQEAEEAGDAEH